MQALRIVSYSLALMAGLAARAHGYQAVTVAQPEFRRTVERHIAEPEMPIKVRCDVHSWVSAWWISQDHPYCALTDSHGAFTPTDVAWHETLGKTTALAWSSPPTPSLGSRSK